MAYNPKEENASQEFLDSSQYTVSGVLQYERIFGRHFISTGGVQTTSKFCQLLGLKPGDRVLDIGCGIGGSAFHMAKQYGCFVKGVDLSMNMLSIARRSAKEMKFPHPGGVEFEWLDATKADFPEGSFDVIYSRDCLIHVGEKLKLFTKCLKWLKPGGKIFISDYIVGPEPWDPEMYEYMKQRDYKLTTLSDYKAQFERAGFTNVIAKDMTIDFIKILKRELEDFAKPEIKQAFIEEFSEADYKHITEGWEIKAYGRSPRGDQRWAVFYAEKPSQTFTNISSKL